MYSFGSSCEDVQDKDDGDMAVVFPLCLTVRATHQNCTTGLLSYR